jgi:hypothetical protein
MATLVNKDAPYSGLSNLMALRGRGGDTELVHMSKPEVRGLASLGELTINPDTGLPEAFELKSILPTIAGIAAAYFTGGTSLLIPALATGATSAIVNKDVGRGLFDGLLSYAGGSIMQGLSGGEEFAKAAGAGAAGWCWCWLLVLVLLVLLLVLVLLLHSKLPPKRREVHLQTHN